MPATSPSRLFHHLGLEALALAVLQVLAQQHLRPVAGLGAAGAGLDVEEAVARVGRVVEHAAELELRRRSRAAWRRRPRSRARPSKSPSAFDISYSSVLSARFAGQVVDGARPRSPAPSSRGPVPGRASGSFQTVGVLERGVDLVQPQRLAVVVKDTPEARRCARSGRRAGCRLALMCSMSMVAMLVFAGGRDFAHGGPAGAARAIKRARNASSAPRQRLGLVVVQHVAGRVDDVARSHAGGTTVSRSSNCARV